MYRCRSKAHIEGEQLLDFLKDLVEAVPQLPPAGSEPAKAPKPKRQRWGDLLAAVPCRAVPCRAVPCRAVP